MQPLTVARTGLPAQLAQRLSQPELSSDMQNCPDVFWDFEPLLLSEGSQRLCHEEAPLHIDMELAPLGCGGIRKGTE